MRRALALGAFGAVAVAAVVIATSLGGGASAGAGASTSTAGSHSASNSVSSSASSTTGTRAHKRPRPVYHGPYAVGLRQESLLEPGTTTTSARPLPTTIMYPAIPGAHAGAASTAAPGPGAASTAAPGPFPLIVFSQGFATSVSAYDGLLEAWTKAGYVVASPTYPFTAPTGPLNEQDIVNHPADLRYVISTLIAQADNRHSQLHRLVNPTEIAVAGQSDGGDVSLAVAANSCCIDHAVKAAVILSGAELSSFGGSYFRGGSPPLLVTQGDHDGINLPGCSATIYNQAPTPKYFVDLLEQDSAGEPAAQDHLGPYTEPGATRNYVARASIAFLDSFLKGRQSPLEDLLAAGGEHGVATITTAPQVSSLGTAC